MSCILNSSFFFRCLHAFYSSSAEVAMISVQEEPNIYLVTHTTHETHGWLRKVTRGVLEYLNNAIELKILLGSEDMTE